MKCDPCEDLNQIKEWLAKLLKKENLPLGDVILLENGDYLLFENGWYILMENQHG